MLRRDFMPRSHNAAFEKGKSGFHGVCMDVAVRVFPRVVNRPVLALLHVVERPRINSRFVRKNNFYVAANVRIDNVSHGLGFGILGTDQAQISVTLSDANNYQFVAAWPPLAGLSANVGLINLNRTTQLLRRYFQHSRSDAMAEVPCRLVADSKCALNLARGHALFGFAEQIGC